MYLKVSIQISCPFLKWVVFILSFKSSSYVLDTNALLSICFAKVSSQCGLPVHCRNVSLEDQNFKILMNSEIHLFLFWIVLLVSKKSLLIPRSQKLSPVFSSRSFIAFKSKLRSMFYFELILYMVQGVG